MKDEDDRQRARIEKIKAYTDQLLQDEKDAENKKAFLKDLKNREAQLSSQIAAAKESGDLNAVADLTVQLEALKTTEARTQQAIRNEASKSALEREKERLEDLKRTISSIGTTTLPALIPPIKRTFTLFGTEITDVASAQQALINLFTGGAKKKSLVEALNDAQVAGANFGKGLKKAFDDITPAIQGLVKWLGDLVKFFSQNTETLGALAGLAGVAKFLGLTSGAGGLTALPIVLKGDTNQEQTPEQKAALEASLTGYLNTLLAWQKKNPAYAGITKADTVLGGNIYGGNTTVAAAIADLQKQIANLKKHGAGGWVGLHGPELGILGDRGPEYIIPADKLMGRGGSSSNLGEGGGTIIIQLGSETIAEVTDRRLHVSKGIYAPVSVLYNGSSR
jgi:hypothetical protein